MCSDDLNDCLECALCIACCYACCLCCCKDNKNNATVAQYPTSPAIISQPHYGATGPGEGAYPQQQHGSYNIPYGQQQKDGSYGFNPNPGGIMQPGHYPPPVSQYGPNPYPQPQQMGNYQPPPPGGPPPPYSYHQGPAPPGSYFPPQPDYYPPNAPYPPPQPNFPEQHGKY